jgi:nucleoid-associated protein YgaU
MGRKITLIVMLALFISACTPVTPRWRQDARLIYDRVRLDGADKVFPADYRSLEEVLLKGEELARKGEGVEADKYFLLAMNKGNLLEKEFIAEQQRRRVEAERLLADKEKQESARQKVLLEEQRRVARARAEAEAKAEAEALARKRQEKLRIQREKPLPAYHTVKRGESLPQIASQQDVYNDTTLWPLIYRANRDQISDPRHIWPGQVLRIPRNATREDIQEARRYAQEKPLH